MILDSNQTFQGFGALPFRMPLRRSVPQTQGLLTKVRNQIAPTIFRPAGGKMLVPTIPGKTFVPPGKTQYLQLDGYNGFGGTWEDWCDKNYFTPENNAKCKNCPIKVPILGNCITPEPWTVAGRLARKLPSKTDLEMQQQSAPPDPIVTVPTPAPPQPVPGVSQPGTVPGSYPAPSTDLIPGVSNTVLILGGLALVGGVAAVALRGRGGHQIKRQRMKRASR
jgi:hypothetical protein